MQRAATIGKGLQNKTGVYEKLLSGCFNLCIRLALTALQSKW
jgi:hypothetical protein